MSNAAAFVVISCACLAFHPNCLAADVETPNPKIGIVNSAFLRTFEPGFYRGQNLNPRHPSRPWNKLLGHKVQVEGVVWGTFAKADYCYIILRNSVVYIDSEDFRDKNHEGKIVRMRGVLATADRRVEDDGTERTFRTYVLKPTKYSVITRVTWPHMRQVKYIPDETKRK